MRLISHLYEHWCFERTGRMMNGKRAKAIAIARNEQQKLRVGIIALSLLLLPALLLLLISP